jgi:hypothetical protein
LFSPEEIKRMSVVHVEYPETMVSTLYFVFILQQSFCGKI